MVQRSFFSFFSSIHNNKCPYRFNGSISQFLEQGQEDICNDDCFVVVYKREEEERTMGNRGFNLYRGAAFRSTAAGK